MGKMKLPKSLLRLLFPKSRKSSNSNKANGNHGGGSSSRTNHHHASSSSSSSWEKDCLHLNSASPPHKKDDQAGYNIAVIEDDDDDETNYTTEAEESILSMSLPPPISLEELLLQCTTTSILNNNANINIDNHSDEDEDDDVILPPTVGASIHNAANVDANDHQLHHANVITPPSSPGNDAADAITIHDRNGNGDDNNDVKRDALLPVVEWDEIAIIPTATIHPNDTDISDHHDGGTSPSQSSTTTTTTAAAAATTTATVNETTNNNNNNNNSTNQTPIDQTKQNQKKKPRVQFSLHGEEARQRAMARQRKILSKAHLRLDSISETSLDHIKEVTTTTTTPTSTATYEETGEELIPLLGDATSAATAKGRKPKRHSRRKSSLEEDEDTEAVVSSSASSVASIASSSYSWGRGKHRGNVSSYIFYESPTSPNKKSTSFSSPLDVAKSTLSEAAAAAAAAVTNDTKENICNYSSQHHDDAIHKNHASAIQFFILLLCPTSRIFELLEINNYFDDIDETITAPTITIQDILSNAIPKHCTDKRLLLQKYVGLVRAEDGTEFVELTAKAFLVHPLSPTSSSSSSDDECEPHSQLFIQRNDLLVAILEGYTGYQMAKMAKPILRNSKFCDMIRRRSGIVSSSSGDIGGDNHASMGRSNGNNTVPLLSYNKEGGSVGVGIESIMSSPSKSRRNPTKKRDTKARSASSAGFKDDTYLSLCQQLKQLSKKLHIVDDEITREDGIVLPVSPTKEDDVAGGGDGQEATTANLTSMATPTKETSCAKFKMTPKMVAHELAMNIEDIFADHDVEIVAVDADDDDDETTMAGLDGETIDVDAEYDDRTDDDTFVSARSMRSLRSSRSMRSLLRQNENRSVIVANDENDDINKPVMEITTKRKERKEKMARGNRGVFDNYEEDDMMLKIEAMARQAESEFESRKKGAVEVPRATIESTVDTMTNTKEDNVVQDSDAIVDNEIDAIPNISEDDDVDDDIEISSPIPSPEPSSQTERDALARSFLNASTTMVSTMVAASQGRVNEVHVLQYLGVTIVCIAANFMQQARSAGAGGPMSPSSLGAGIGGGGGSGFGARDVLQSAMFLAFMVNGQRYMAKVTKK